MEAAVLRGCSAEGMGAHDGDGVLDGEVEGCPEEADHVLYPAVRVGDVHPGSGPIHSTGIEFKRRESDVPLVWPVSIQHPFVY